MSLEGIPLRTEASSQSIFEKTRASKGKQKERISIMDLYGCKDPTLKMDPRFFVRAMSVPTIVNFRDWINYSFNYVKVKVHRAQGKASIEVALNVNSLAKRLGLTSKELRGLKKEELEKLISNRTELIDSHKDTIDQYHLDEGSISLKSEHGGTTFKRGLSPITFLKMLNLANQHAKKLAENPEESSEITIKDEHSTEHRFIVTPYQGAGPDKVGSYHIFSFENQAAEVLGSGGMGTAAKVRSVANQSLVIKYAHEYVDNPDATREEQDDNREATRKADESLEKEAVNLDTLDQVIDPGQRKLFQSAPKTKAKVLRNLTIIENNKEKGTVTQRTVNTAIIVELCEKGDLFEALRDPKISSSQRQKICLRLGDILSQGKLFAHGDIKTENFFMDKDGLPTLADFGSANIITKKEGYVSPIVAGLYTTTPVMVTEQEHHKIETLKMRFEVMHKRGKKPVKKEVAEALSLIQQTDVFAMGSTMYEVFTRCLPYWRDKNDSGKFPRKVTAREQLREDDRMRKVLKASGCNEELGEMIIQMVQQDPNNRLKTEKFPDEWQELSKSLQGLSRAKPMTRENALKEVESYERVFNKDTELRVNKNTKDYELYFKKMELSVNKKTTDAEIIKILKKYPLLGFSVVEIDNPKKPTTKEIALIRKEFEKYCQLKVFLASPGSKRT